MADTASQISALKPRKQLTVADLAPLMEDDKAVATSAATSEHVPAEVLQAIDDSRFLMEHVGTDVSSVIRGDHWSLIAVTPSVDDDGNVTFDEFNRSDDDDDDDDDDDNDEEAARWLLVVGKKAYKKFSQIVQCNDRGKWVLFDDAARIVFTSLSLREVVQRAVVPMKLSASPALRVRLAGNPSAAADVPANALKLLHKHMRKDVTIPTAAERFVVVDIKCNQPHMIVMQLIDASGATHVLGYVAATQHWFLTSIDGSDAVYSKSLAAVLPQ